MAKLLGDGRRRLSGGWCAHPCGKKEILGLIQVDAKALDADCQILFVALQRGHDLLAAFLLLLRPHSSSHLLSLAAHVN